jgi:hypothetical protein
MPMSRGERESLIDQYARGPERVRAALATAPREALKWRPEPGRWSVHEIVVHCADAETNAALRIRYLLAEKDPLIVGYDQDATTRSRSRSRSSSRPRRASARCRSCGG